VRLQRAKSEEGAFSEFLNVAALSDAELVNFSTIARDCGVSGPTVKGGAAL